MTIDWTKYDKYDQTSVSKKNAPAPKKKPKADTKKDDEPIKPLKRRMAREGGTVEIAPKKKRLEGKEYDPATMKYADLNGDKKKVLPNLHTRGGKLVKPSKDKSVWENQQTEFVNPSNGDRVLSPIDRADMHLKYQDMMTDEEKKAFNEMWKTAPKNAISQYNQLYPELEKRNAKNAGFWERNILSGAVKYMKSGSLATVSLLDEAMGGTQTEELKALITGDMKYMEGAAEKNAEGGKAEKLGGDVVQAMAQLVPQVVLSMINPILGGASLAVPAVGSYSEQARLDGASVSERLIYGALGGGAEAALQKVLFINRVVGSLGKGLGGTGAVVDGTLNILKSIQAKGLEVAKSALGEGLEEAAIDPFTGLVKKLTYAPDTAVFGEGGVIDPKQMAYDGLIGAIAGGSTSTVFQATTLPKLVEAKAYIDENYPQALVMAYALPDIQVDNEGGQKDPELSEKTEFWNKAEETVAKLTGKSGRDAVDTASSMVDKYKSKQTAMAWRDGGKQVSVADTISFMRQVQEDYDAYGKVMAQKFDPTIPEHALAVKKLANVDKSVDKVIAKIRDTTQREEGLKELKEYASVLEDVMRIEKLPANYKKKLESAISKVQTTVTSFSSQNSSEDAIRTSEAQNKEGGITTPKTDEEVEAIYAEEARKEFLANDKVEGVNKSRRERYRAAVDNGLYDAIIDEIESGGSPEKQSSAIRKLAKKKGLKIDDREAGMMISAVKAMNKKFQDDAVERRRKENPESEAKKTEKPKQEPVTQKKAPEKVNEELKAKAKKATPIGKMKDAMVKKFSAVEAEAIRVIDAQGRRVLDGTKFAKYSELSALVETVRKNPLFNAVTFEFRVGGGEVWYTKEEAIANGYQEAAQYYKTDTERRKFFQVGWHQETGDGRFRVVLTERASAKTVLEELIHHIQLELVKGNPEFQKALDTWEKNYAGYLRSIGVDVNEGNYKKTVVEGFAHAVMISEMGWYDGKDSVITGLTVQSELVSTIRDIMGAELFESLLGENENTNATQEIPFTKAVKEYVKNGKFEGRFKKTSKGDVQFQLYPVDISTKVNRIKEAELVTLVHAPEGIDSFDKALPYRELRSIEEAYGVNHTPERVADYQKKIAEAMADKSNFYAKGDVIKYEEKAKLKSLFSIRLTTGCGRNTILAERVLVGLESKDSEFISCYGGACFVNWKPNAIIGPSGWTNVNVRDTTFAKYELFDKWLSDADLVRRMNEAPFLRHGVMGCDSHTIATGLALKWLQACRKAGVTSKNVFVSASYAPVTDEQYKELLPYKDIMTIHFTVSPWFSTNECMIRLAEFARARDIGLDPILRVVTNADNVSRIEMTKRYGWLKKQMADAGISQSKILETPFHDDSLGTKPRSKPTGDFLNICCEGKDDGDIRATCKACRFKCLNNPDPKKNIIDYYQPLDTSEFDAGDKNIGERAYPTDMNFYQLSLDDVPFESLTPMQYEKFKDSKVVNEHGELRVMYHGTRVLGGRTEENTKIVIDQIENSEEITYRGQPFSAFDFGSHFGTRLQANYFASDLNTNGYEPIYNRVYPVFLDIRDPARMKDEGHGWSRKVRELEADGYDGIVYLNRYEGVRPKGKTKPFENFYRLLKYAERWYKKNRPTKHMSETQLGLLTDEEFLEIFDADDSYIAFNPNQVKSVFNENPTDADDIMYQMALATDEEGVEQVVWKPDRVSYLLDAYGSKGTPAYAKAYAGYIDPESFLNLTSSDLYRPRLERENKPLDVEKLVGERQEIQLYIDRDEGAVVGHEGRHRMMALRDAGYRRVAIALIDYNGDRYNTKPIQNLTLTGQDFGGMFGKAGGEYTFDEIIPIGYGHEQDLLDKFSYSQAHGLSYSLELDLSEPEPRASYDTFDQTFYSYMELVIERKWKKGSAEQLLAMLRNNGVKEDELKWSGLLTHLNESDGAIEKDALLQWLRDNRLQVVETQRTEDWLNQFDAVKERSQNIGRHLASAMARSENSHWGDFDRVDQYVVEVVDNVYLSSTGVDAAIKHVNVMTERNGVDMSTVPDDLLRAYVLSKIERRRAHQRMVDSSYENRASKQFKEAYTVDGFGTWDYREILFRVPDALSKTYLKKVHWGDAENVVAHARTSDKVSADGERVLFLEEVQSDLHEDAVKQGGYAEAPDLSGYRIEKLRDSYYNFYDSEGKFVVGYNAFGGEDEAWRKLESHFMRDSAKPPQAPFRKTWHEFVLKRLLRIAADEGYDRIAWTTGKQQNKFYGLSKSIGAIDIQVYTPSPNKTYKILIQNKNGDYVDGYDGVGKVVTPKELDATVGRDYAALLIEKADAVEKPYYSDWVTVYPSQELEVGGTGMKNFYDIGGKSSQNIPKFLNSYGKQWGASVDEVYIAGELQPSMAITPAMRDSILREKQALFQLEYDGAELADSIREENLVKNGGGKARLESRVRGDALLDAEDLIEEIVSRGGTVDEYGYVTVYHATTKSAAEAIASAGRMSAKEDGIFFSTKPDGQITGYGDAVVELSVPAEKLVIDDVFSNEVHLKLPLKSKLESADIRAYLVKQDKTNIMLQLDYDPSQDYDLSSYGAKTFKKNPNLSKKATKKIDKAIVGGDLNYNIMHNDDLISMARDYIFKNTVTNALGVDDYSKIEQWILSDAPATPLMNAVAMLMQEHYLNKRLFVFETGVTKAIALVEAVSKKATTSGQAIQALSMWSRFTPEGIIRYATRILTQSLSDAEANQVRMYALELEQAFGRIDAEKIADVNIEKLVDEVIDEYDDKAAEVSAVARILSQSIEGDSVSLMANTIMKYAQERFPNRKHREPLDYVIDAIKNRKLYKEVWRETQNDLWKIIPEGDKNRLIVSKFFNYTPTSFVDESMLKRAIGSQLRDMKTSIRNIVESSYESQRTTIDAVVNELIQKGNLNKVEAEMLEKKVRKALADMTTSMKEKYADRMFSGKKVKNEAGKTAIDRIVELSNAGVLTLEDYEMEIANRLGLRNANPEFLAYLHEQAQNLQELEGRDKLEATARIMDDIASQMPVGFWKKVGTFQTMMQLLNPVTFLRNLYGNTTFSVAEYFSEIAAIPMDMLAAALGKTKFGQTKFAELMGMEGRRTTLFDPINRARRQMQAWKSGLTGEWSEIHRNINTHSMGSYNRWDVPVDRVFRGRGIGTLERWLSYELRMFDKAAYSATYADSIAEQLAISGSDTITPEMEANAHQLALYRTFQDDNRYSAFFTSMKNTFNVVGFGERTQHGKIKPATWGFGDIVLKYPKTPANLLARSVDYSPIGLITTFTSLLADKQSDPYLRQKNLSLGLARAGLGTLLWGIGYMMYAAGVIIGSPDDEEKEGIANLKRAAGISKYQLNVDALGRWLSTGGIFGGDKQSYQNGDRLMTYNWLMPFGIGLSIGADIARLGTTEKAGMSYFTDMVDTGLNALSASTNAFAEQPMMTTLTKAFGGGGFDQAKNNLISGMATAAVGAPSSFYPTVLARTKSIFDNRSLNLYNGNSDLQTAANQFIYKTPLVGGVGAVQGVESYTTPFGEDSVYWEPEKKALGWRIFDAFLQPANTAAYNPDPLVKWTLNVYDLAPDMASEISPSSKVKWKYKMEDADGVSADVELTQAEYKQLSAFKGKLMAEAYQKVMEKYPRVTTQEEAEAVASALYDAKKGIGEQVTAEAKRIKGYR